MVFYWQLCHFISYFRSTFEENVVLSDVSESYEDMISREVENEINEEWHNTSKFNIFKRLNLFLRR